MIYSIVAVSILAFVSGISKAVMDTLLFHFDTSIFSDKGNWWNPTKSWKNKYDWAKSNRIVQWILSNPLVSITDAWHFFQLLFSATFASAFFVSGIFLPWWTAFIVYALNRVIFHIFFTWAFKK